jgi:type I restriction enzyme M protein
MKRSINDNVLRTMVGESGMNERKTEDIVREVFKRNKISFPTAIIEEQKTENMIIKKLLQSASKKGEGCGKPEFIVSFSDIKDFVIIVECKPNPECHESKTLDKFDKYAVDGVLLYSQYVSKEFNVIAIAVSGETEKELKVTNFLQLSGEPYKRLENEKILSFEAYIKILKKDPDKERKDTFELMKYSRKLHDELRDILQLAEKEKPLLVSAILIALEDESFVVSYVKKKNASELADLLCTTVQINLKRAGLPEPKIKAVMHEYGFIKYNEVLTTDVDGKGKPVKFLYDLIKHIEDKVRPFLMDHEHIDILGHFYGEFLRYSGGEKKGLGIVLTPRHITELFVDCADVKKNDVILDNCCGSAGFLVSAMNKMVEDAHGDADLIEKIKHNRLIGIEQRPEMFALACANMILRDDGKTNIYLGDCFVLSETVKKNHKCTVGLLNPPYSQKAEGLSELDFVINCLDCLEKNSICMAIVPLSCATAPSPQKKLLLDSHTLEAVMSVPNEVFNPQTSVVTCIMVFRAKVPHNLKKEVWFGYWKDDGFVKTKHLGRIDKFGKWPAIKKRWLETYNNRKEINGESLLREVTADDEWCAEAYMKTDYSKINKSDFVEELKKYIIYKINEKGESYGKT